MEGDMFIYSVRASTIKFFSIILLTVVVLIVILAAGGNAQAVYAASNSVSFSGIKTNEDRVEFISQFGIRVSPGAVEEEEFRVPENFDRVIAGYNEIQKQQGLDITKYKNKKVTRYTYEAEGYKDFEGKVFVNLIVFRNTVIACDISSTDPQGFIEPLVKLG
jgi:hypothetical protein